MAAATSCAAVSSGSSGPSSAATTGPWNITAPPWRSATMAPTRRSLSPRTTKAPQARASRSGQAIAAKSNSARARVASVRGRYPTPLKTRGSVADASEAVDGGESPASGVSAGAAARGIAGRRPPGRFPLLLLPKHRVLQALGQTELAHALGRDLDGLARLGIAADARLAIGQHQLAESREHELSALLRLTRGEGQRLVEHTLDLLLREARLLGEMRQRRGLCNGLRHVFPPVDGCVFGARCLNTTADEARLPRREAKFARRDETAIRTKACLDVLDRIERRGGILTLLVALYDVVERVTLRRHASQVADPAPQLGGAHQLTVLRAGRGGDGFVDERATEVVGPRLQQRLRELWSFLHPRGLDVRNDRSQHDPRERVHADHVGPGGAGTHAGHQALGVHRRFAVDERKRHELGEATGVLLNVAQQGHVAHPVLGRLHVA